MTAAAPVENQDSVRELIAALGEEDVTLEGPTITTSSMQQQQEEEGTNYSNLNEEGGRLATELEKWKALSIRLKKREDKALQLVQVSSKKHEEALRQLELTVHQLELVQEKVQSYNVMANQAEQRAQSLEKELLELQTELTQCFTMM